MYVFFFVFLLNPNFFCKHYSCELHNTFTTRGQQLYAWKKVPWRLTNHLISNIFLRFYERNESASQHFSTELFCFFFILRQPSVLSYLMFNYNVKWPKNPQWYIKTTAYWAKHVIKKNICNWKTVNLIIIKDTLARYL